MNRRTLLIRTGILLASAFLPVARGCQTGETEQITIAGQEFVLEVVTTEDAIQRGLGGRAAVPDNGGMLFVFPVAKKKRFWMKDCLIDIDIMFLSKLGRITAIHEMKAEPLKTEDESQFDYEQRLKGYSSIATAQFAIELKAGRIAELGLQPGQQIDLPIDCLKQRLK